MARERKKDAELGGAAGEKIPRERSQGAYTGGSSSVKRTPCLGAEMSSGQLQKKGNRDSGKFKILLLENRISACAGEERSRKEAPSESVRKRMKRRQLPREEKKGSR